MSKLKADGPYRAWVRRHALRLAILNVVIHALALVLVLVYFDRLDRAVGSDAFNRGALWGMAYVLVVMGLAASVGTLRRVRKPAPVPVDPANPPTPGIFAYDPEDPDDPEVLCHCHGRPIAAGQSVVQWPQPPKYTCTDADEERTK
jgi:hypothetical protein